MTDIIEKLDRYIGTPEQTANIVAMVEAAEFMEMELDYINEAFDLKTLKSGGKALLSKIGIHAGKEGKGLIDVAIKSGKVMAQFIWYALKAAAGNEDAKVKLKELANTEIKKEDVLDFLLRLDQATLHAVTGPIHMIDAVTGWHIWANIHTKMKNSIAQAKEAISSLIIAAKGAETAVKKKLKSLMHGIARLFGLEDEQKEISRALA